MDPGGTCRGSVTVSDSALQVRSDVSVASTLTYSSGAQSVRFVQHVANVAAVASSHGR
jgi:hypothetical protein